MSIFLRYYNLFDFTLVRLSKMNKS